MTNIDRAAIIAVAEDAARKAGAFIREAFLAAASGTSLAIEQKDGFADLVTVVDRQSEKLIRDVIGQGVPGSRILGEETGWQGEGDVLWFVDPLDGTSNFISGLPFFCVSIAATTSQGEALAGVVYDPMRDELFSAHASGLHINGQLLAPGSLGATDDLAEVLTNLPREGRRPAAHELERFADLVAHFRSVRRLGSSALHLAYVAAGRASVAVDLGCGAWDIAAGMQLVQAAGGQLLCRAENTSQTMLAPLLDIERVHSLVAATAGYELEGSAAFSYLEAS